VDPTLQETFSLLVQIATGISLAACAGLRVFLPLLVVGAAGRLDYLPLSSSFEWLESTPALIVFGVAVIVELLADKVPVVDSFLDIAQTAVKPIAGTILAASVITELSPLQTVAIGIVLGGSAAGAVHLLKANTRVVALATTGGVGNPVVSVVEDAGALIGSVGAILVPVIMLVLLLVMAWLTVLAFRRFRRRATSPARA